MGKNKQKSSASFSSPYRAISALTGGSLRPANLVLPPCAVGNPVNLSEDRTGCVVLSRSTRKSHRRRWRRRRRRPRHRGDCQRQQQESKGQKRDPCCRRPDDQPPATNAAVHIGGAKGLLRCRQAGLQKHVSSQRHSQAYNDNAVGRRATTAPADCCVVRRVDAARLCCGWHEKDQNVTR